jgi:hypothetical protein
MNAKLAVTRLLLYATELVLVVNLGKGERKMKSI